MRRLFCIFPLLFLMVCPASAAQNDSAIRDVLDAQAKAWNNGDIAAFVSYYAENCTFVGNETTHGQAELLARYQRRYPSRDAMGKLNFSGLVVERLDSQVAVAYGTWHLDRGTAGGGPVGGVFSLVLQQMQGRWRIVLDHTA